MANCYIGNKPKYDVEMFFEENKSSKEPMYVVNKIIVNNPKMYDFYFKNYPNIELIKGFING